VAVKPGADHVDLPVTPSPTAGGRIFLVVNPRPGIVLADERPPALQALRIDGKPMPTAATCRLPDDAPPPERIEWEFEDTANPLAAEDLAVLLDGNPVPPERLKTRLVNPKHLLVRLDTRGLEYGRHTVEAAVPDQAPLRNTCRVSAVFSTFDPTNLLRRDPGVAEVLVDSHYPDYPSVAALTDGILPVPGGGAGNAETWASAEDGAPHWVEIRLKAPATIREVTVYWAPRDTARSRRLEILVPEGKSWRVVAAAPKAGLPPKPQVTLRFTPVKTDRFRVRQPAGGGSKARPGLLWIAEIEAR
jgi:hypothetical protein